MRKSVKIPRILKIDKIDGLKIYVIFNNGETRLLDFGKILTDWNIKKSDIESKLYDQTEIKKVKLRNQTLSWDNLSVKLKDDKGQEKEFPYEIGPDVLYELSQDSDIQIQGYGDIVRKARIKAGLTQDELARRAGTTRFYISRFENNKSDIELSTFKRIIESGLGKRLTYIKS
jgi:ribosome-binding protein aMBF1 (putative translation factor)